jgi:hypothetical protein
MPRTKARWPAIEVFLNGENVLRYDDGRAALPDGTVGLLQSQLEARYRNLWFKTVRRTQALPTAAAA